VRDAFAVEHGAGAEQIGERVRGVFGRVAGERAQSLEFAHGFDPFADVRPRDVAPPFDCEGEVNGPEQRFGDDGEHLVAGLVAPLDQPPQASDLAGRRKTSRLQALLQSREQRRLEWLLLEARQHLGQDAEIVRRGLHASQDSSDSPPHHGEEPERRQHRDQEGRERPHL
jgi:hypothetical protein